MLIDRNDKKELGHLGMLFFAIFALFFIVFLRFPLNDSLFGNIDIWFYVWQMNDFFNHTFGSAPAGQILFPSTELVKIAESPLGIGLIYSPFKFFIKNDIWVFYLLSCTVLSLNGTSFYLLIKSFNLEKRIAIVFAFLFAFNNFALANVENFNAFVLFPGIIAAYALRKAIICPGKNSWKYYIISALFAGMQLYFSMYFFVFQFIIIGVILLFNLKQIRTIILPMIIWAVLLVLIMIPFVVQHQGLPNYLDKYELLKSASIHNEAHSIQFVKDFFRVDPGNLLYPAMDDIINPWRYAARTGFYGFSTYLLMILSIVFLWRKKQKRLLYFALSIIVIAMAISTGPYLKTIWYEVKTPIGWINAKWVHTNAFRHFFRAHLVTIAGSLLLIAFFFDYAIKHKMKWANIGLILFGVLFLAENLNVKAELFPSKQYLEPSADLLNAIEEIPKESNLFFLPSCHLIMDEKVVAEPINQINREFIYASWKNYIPYNIFNGRLSYVTDEAYENSYLTCQMNSLKLNTLIQNNEIDEFVICKEFMSKVDTETLIPILNRQTKLIKENESFLVYKVNR